MLKLRYYKTNFIQRERERERREEVRETALLMTLFNKIKILFITKPTLIN